MSKFSKTKFDKTFWVKKKKTKQSKKIEPQSSLDFFNYQICFILKIWAEIHHTLILHLNILCEFYIEKCQKKYLERTVLKLVIFSLGRSY